MVMVCVILPNVLERVFIIEAFSIGKFSCKGGTAWVN